MMRATFSGQAGIAVIHEEPTVMLYSMDNFGAPQRIPIAQAKYLFGGATDVTSVEVADHPAVIAALTTAWACDRLLQMLLILLRQDSVITIRADAAEVAEELIVNEGARSFALNRLYSHPMTNDGDIDGAIGVAKRAHARETAERLRQLRGHQPVIAAMATAWQTVLATLVQPSRNGRELRGLLERMNVFHTLALANRASEVDRLTMSWLQSPLSSGVAGVEPMIRALADARKQAYPAAVAPVTETAQREHEHVARSRSTSGRNPEEIYLEHLRTIERIASFVAHKHRLNPDETEEFAHEVRVRLLEDDYAIFREFKDKTSLSTYLTTVITRLYQQYRVEQWGKWRPSAEAKRLGDKAIALERLLTRDGYSFAEAVRVLTTPTGSPYTAAELEAIYLRLPLRNPRPMPVSDDLSPEAVRAESHTDAGVEMRDRERAAREVVTELDEILKSIEPEDRLILQLRFESALKAPDIAHRLQLKQKKVYKRLDRLFATLRRALERKGIAQQAISDLLSHPDTDLSFGLRSGDEVQPRRATERPGRPMDGDKNAS